MCLPKRVLFSIFVVTLFQMLHTYLDYPLLAGGNSLKRFGQSIKRIVREVEEQNTGQLFLTSIVNI